MEHLMYLLKGYSLPILLISYLCILIVGILKTLGLFKKLSKQVKTIVLFAIDISLSLVGTAIYFKISNFEFTAISYLTTTSIVITCILSMYSLYENIGVKKLVASILALLVKALKDTASKRADAKEKAKYEGYAIIAEAVSHILAGETPVLKPQESTTQEVEEKRGDSPLHR